MAFSSPDLPLVCSAISQQQPHTLTVVAYGVERVFIFKSQKPKYIDIKETSKTTPRMDKTSTDSCPRLMKTFFFSSQGKIGTSYRK